MRAQLLQSQARIIIHGNRSLMHRAFYCVILHVFQKLVYTYQLYAQNKQLRCLNQLVDRREGRGDTDVGVMGYPFYKGKVALTPVMTTPASFAFATIAFAQPSRASKEIK